MSSKIAYPWFFFTRIARLSLLVFLPTLFLILFIYRSSYREGLVSQMTFQIQENLRTTKFTIEASKLSWKEWCEHLPKDLQVQYALIKSDGSVVCHSDSGRILQGQVVAANLKISPDLIIQKTVPINSLKDDMNRFDRALFFRIVPFALISYLLFLLLFYKATRPLGSVLAKVQKFKDGIPMDRTLQLLYKKDEWAHIEEALNKADRKLQDQVVQAQTENQKITAILESIYDDIIAVDTFETVLFYNSKFKRNFIQEKPESELSPRLWHTITDEHVLKVFRTVLKTGETNSLKAMNFLSSRHPDRYFDLTVTPLKGVEGKVTGALGVFYDVTDFKLTEQMRVDFVANVSHEIRTPLTSIKGYTQIMQAQSNKIDPSLHLFLGKIITNTERMISLFNSLLSLSVIESGNRVEFEEFAIEPVIDAVSENISTNYPDKSIGIQKDIKLENIQGDQRLIEQVLSNLFDNACKYSHRDDIKIHISVIKKGNHAYLVLKDNGPGIEKDHLQRIFERFYRVDSSREGSRGTGLGLSIVKHIIAKHEGKVWAENSGEGASFHIELPLENIL
jgi:two-component system, OmpR family, phosphate regulon sensor histidine kinase PhoR